MNRIQGGDPDALEELYVLYNRLLYGLVVSIVKKREEAEDTVNEIFLKIWNSADSYTPEKGSVYNWVITLARNKAIDRIRSKDFKTQQKMSVSIDNSHFFPEGKFKDPLETTIFSDRAKLVTEALEKIPGEQREVIEMAYYQGMTQSEIATNLDIPLGTVKTRTRQGLIKLNRMLKELIIPND